VAGGTAPDQRTSTVPLTRDAFAAVVRDGSLETRGMPKFGELTDAELDALRHYIRYRARMK
jgi:quinohemoprotein ethanol dehydrogenase